MVQMPAESEPARDSILTRLLRLVRRFLVAGLVLYWVSLFILTHVPMPKSGGHFNDKVLHLGAYGMLAFMMTWVWSPRHKKLIAWLSVVAICSVYGMTDELLQAPIPSRTADFWDWVADVVGAGCGSAAFLLLQSLWRRYRARR